MRIVVVAILLFLSPSLSSAYCFLVYKSGGPLVYRSTEPPIDLSLPISQGLKARFPDSHLVVTPDDSSYAGAGTSDNAKPSVIRPTVSASPPSALDSSPLFVNSKPLAGMSDLGLSPSTSNNIGGLAGSAGSDASVRSDTRTRPAPGTKK